MAKKQTKDDSIPRFIVEITDTNIAVPGPNGEKYFSIAAGADKLSDFNRIIPKHKRTTSARTELQSMFLYMEENVREMESNPYVPPKNKAKKAKKTTKVVK